MLPALLVPEVIQPDQAATTPDSLTSTSSPSFKCLDFCCGSGEFTQILNAWCTRNHVACEIVGADPFTREAYTSVTGKVAKSWSFEDVCDGVLLDEDDNTFDAVTICYAIHLLEPSRNYSFFNTMAQHAKWMLIVSPTKNKGVVDESLGWEQINYLTDRKVHARFYRSLLFAGDT